MKPGSKEQTHRRKELTSGKASKTEGKSQRPLSTGHASTKDGSAMSPTAELVNSYELNVSQSEAELKRRQEMFNFYYKILEKDPLKPEQVVNPILRFGGREAFISDIEKLRNAEQAINDTLLRIQQMPPAVQIPLPMILSATPLDSSQQLSPMSEV